MREIFARTGVTMHIAHGCLVVPIQVELSDEAMLEIQTEILEKVSQTGVKGVLIDLAGVDILDSFLAQAFLDTGRMASLLGADTVIVGLKRELVSVLIDLGLDFGNIQTAITLEQGFQKLKPIVEPEEKPEEIEEMQEPEEETAKETSGDSVEEPAEREEPDNEAAGEPGEESQEESLAEDEA
ncbi:MAG: STAS domain-containing protein [Chlamydiota bacterium]